MIYITLYCFMFRWSSNFFFVFFLVFLLLLLNLNFFFLSPHIRFDLFNIVPYFPVKNRKYIFIDRISGAYRERGTDIG